MNFLAHLYLSGDDKDLILGNFIADMVKGKQIEKFSPGIIRGIKMHRMIDEFTDSHKIVARSKTRLRSKYRHYSAVIVDMYYDHFLARNWKEYSDVSIDNFLNNAYNVLLRNYLLLPSKAQKILPYMISANWLVNYGDLERLQKNFEGLSRRTPFESGMENAVEDLIKNYNDFLSEFREFFPQLVDYVSRIKIKQ